MKRKLTFFLILFAVVIGFAQEKTVIQCEYWIDNSRRCTIPVSGEEVSFVVDASGIQEGIHTLNYRVMDSEEVYSPLQTWLFIKNEFRDTSIINHAVLVEYWIDEDKRKIIGVPGNEIEFFVDASTIDEGLHILYYRIKDALGNYSSLEKWVFFKTRRIATKIMWYKYWWNNNQDKAIKENVSADSVFVFNKQLTVPEYAKTDGFSRNSTARLQIVFGDDLGNISNVEWADISYPDEIAPITTIEADKTTSANTVNLKWTPNEDNIEYYNIYYSENDKPFVLWLPNTTSKTAVFKGQAGYTYRFTVTATDKAGNKEAYNEHKNISVKFE